MHKKERYKSFIRFSPVVPLLVERKIPPFPIIATPALLAEVPAK